MKKLHFFQPTVSDTLASPEKLGEITLNSPALKIFTDLKLKSTTTVKASDSAVKVKAEMQQSEEKTRLVVDQNGAFVGLVTPNELNDMQIIRMTSQGHERDDIRVSEMMIRRSKLLAFDIAELEEATIEDVVITLKESGNHHCLVLDRQSHQIRGVLSANSIAKKLEAPIHIQDRSSFYKVFSAAAH